MATQVIMPQLGESVVEGTVGRWLVSEGQPVKQYEPLLAITTDKVDTEISAPATGILLKIYVPEGQTVERGTVLAVIGAAGESVPPVDEDGAAGGRGATAAPHGAAPTMPTPGGGATPVAQRVAQEHGVDLAAVTGTGPGGRITKEDVEAHLAGTAPSASLPPEEGDRGRSPSASLPPEEGDRGRSAGEPSSGRAEAGGQAPAGAAPPPAAGARGGLGFISPAVARLAAEHGVDLGRVTGTGEGGRISKKDVLAFIAGGQGPLRFATREIGGARPAPAETAGELPPWEQPGSGSLFKPSEEMAAPQAAVAAPTAPGPAATTDLPRSPSSGGREAEGDLPRSEAEGAAAGRAPAGADRESELQPLSTIRRSIAKHMVSSKQTAPHVTTVMEADLTQVVRARERLKDEYERQGAHLTFTPFFVQAIVAGLHAVPEANSTFQDDALLLHRRIHIGVAVAIADGLIVPVIRDADEKSLLGLARAVNDLARRARARQLAADEVQGGTFTLTNHGTAGSLLATPIINQPQAGILGVGAIQKRPVVVGSSTSLLPGPDDYIAIRPMAYLSFSFDHRVLDGAGADRFLGAVKDYLESYHL